MTTIKNVVVLGATGRVGLQVVHALSEAHLTVTAASRSLPSTTSSPFSPSIRVVTVDYTSLASLTTLFTNQDAVISAFNPSLLTTYHTTITDAILSSSIKHIITPDFSSDTFNPHAHELEIFEPKIIAQKYLEEKIKGTDAKWTAVITGPFFDWAIPSELFWISPANKAITVFGSGNQKVSMSRLAITGAAVVAILSSPSEYENRPAYFANFVVSTNQLVEIVQEIARERGEERWNVVNVSLETFFEEGKRLYREDTERGVEDRLNSRAYQILGTYGVFEEGNRYGSDFGEKAEAGWEKGLEELKEELRSLV